MKSYYPNFNFSKDKLDGVHHNYTTYQLLDPYNIEPFIALNIKNKTNRKYTKCDITVDENSIYYCKSGHKNLILTDIAINGSALVSALKLLIVLSFRGLKMIIGGLTLNL